MRKTLLAIALVLFPCLALADMGKSVDYTVNGQPFEGYYVSPGANAPFVLLVHDWDGLTDYEVKRADMLAALGYAVFCADLFGKGVRPGTVEERRKLTGALYKDRESMRALQFGALDEARRLGANVANGAAMGYCFGGTAVLELARAGAGLKAFVPFHGGLATPDGQDYSRLNGFILVFHGTSDASVSMDEFAALAKSLEALHLPHEMITYGGAPHAFTVFGSERYREDADRKSWDRFTRFLADTLR